MSSGLLPLEYNLISYRYAGGVSCTTTRRYFGSGTMTSSCFFVRNRSNFSSSCEHHVSHGHPSQPTRSRLIPLLPNNCQVVKEEKGRRKAEGEGEKVPYICIELLYESARSVDISPHECRKGVHFLRFNLLLRFCSRGARLVRGENSSGGRCQGLRGLGGFCGA